ncbi:hypothetical protein SO802_023265 [Lithocarpus litseifolius]|uniref:Uncharacterized protein n=1 Tax=Lithocarpus litseifolius TaxID=425828 RepID=A0AAW2C7Q2_9ROSI
MIGMTLRDLETTKQGVRETFSEYMTRWKTKASRMVNRPNEKDQINMIIKNLLPTYNNRLLSSLISSFGELCDCGTRIEDTINNGQLKKGEHKPPTKKTYGGGATTTKAPNSGKCKRHYTPTNTSLPKESSPRILQPRNEPHPSIRKPISSKEFIKPLDPKLMPNPIPSTWKLNENCHYHKKSNHKTDNCFRLKH